MDDRLKWQRQMLQLCLEPILTNEVSFVSLRCYSLGNKRNSRVNRLDLIPVLTLLVTLTVTLLITRIATVALTLTGLSHESARFQARSAMTGVGFTSRESEGVVNHPVRRRIIMWLMLLGNAGIVTMIATLMASFVNASPSNNEIVRNLLVLLIGLVALFWFANS